MLCQRVNAFFVSPFFPRLSLESIGDGCPLHGWLTHLARFFLGQLPVANSRLELRGYIDYTRDQHIQHRPVYAPLATPQLLAKLHRRSSLTPAMSSETDYDSLPSPPKQSRAGGLQRRRGATTRRYGKRGTKPAPPSAAGPSQPTAGKRRLDSSSSDDDGELSTPSPEGRSAPSKQSQAAAARRKKASTKGKERALEEPDADVESEAEGAQTSPIKTVSIGRPKTIAYVRVRCVEMLTMRARARSVTASPQAQEDQDDFGGLGRTADPLDSEEATLGSGGI